jgi:glycosyltransferase involved in cell wall biosynthesis
VAAQVPAVTGYGPVAARGRTECGLMPDLGMPNLPDPPPGKTGWPWTVDACAPEESLPGGTPWPRASVVTPSLNQGEFLEQTIRSVLLQGYPDLEYIVVDGGSTDGSVEILRKYDQFITRWTSEPDRGQSHAVNKGFALSTGEIMCWLNSDDFLMPGALRAVAEILAGGGAFAVVGHALKVYTDGRPPHLLEGRFEGLPRLLEFWKGYRMHQPSIFWRREVFERVGFLDEGRHYVMDFDYWVRIARHFDFVNLDRVLAGATYHERAKTGDNYEAYYRELRSHAPHFWGSPLGGTYWRLRSSLMAHQAGDALGRACRPLVTRGRWHADRAFRHARAFFKGR